MRAIVVIGIVAGLTVGGCGGGGSSTMSGGASTGSADAASFRIYDPQRPQADVVGLADVASAKQGVDSITNAPDVIVDLTPAGQRKFRGLTLAAVQRAEAANQMTARFVISYGGRPVSQPVIDVTQNPAGIDPGNGIQIEGGLTASKAQALASALNSG